MQGGKPLEMVVKRDPTVDLAPVNLLEDSKEEHSDEDLILLPETDQGPQLQIRETDTFLFLTGIRDKNKPLLVLPQEYDHDLFK